LAEEVKLDEHATGDKPDADQASNEETYPALDLNHHMIDQEVHGDQHEDWREVPVTEHLQ